MNVLKFNLLLSKVHVDKQAAEQIYKEFFPIIVLRLRGKFGNLICAEDIAQDVFLSLIASPQTNYISHPTAWLFTTAENRAKDFLKKHREEYTLDDKIYACPYTVDNSLLDIDLQKAFSKLDETSQKILYLYYWEGYDFYEIAKMLSLKPGNVRTKASRAYKILKSLL